MTATPTPVTVWIDPSCPWAWQGAKWLRHLAADGHVVLEWHLFSLEVNAVREMDPDAPLDFWSAAERHGTSLVSLQLALHESTAAFESLYEAIGVRLHERKQEPSADLVRAAATETGMTGILDRALARPHIAEEVVREYSQARERDVFGVPSLSIDGSKVVYGPLVARAPEGADALELWQHTRWLAERTDFFELKRWPRDVRPGALAS